MRMYKSNMDRNHKVTCFSAVICDSIPSIDIGPNCQLQQFYRHSSEACLENNLGICDRFVSLINAAAQASLRTKSIRQKQIYLSGHTWQLIWQRQRMREQRTSVKNSFWTGEIKKRARRDKLTWKLNKLEDRTDSKAAWKEVRREKQSFMPKFYDFLQLAV